MKTLPAFLLAAVAVILISPAARPQTGGTSQEEPEGEIGGIVLSAKTGEPLKGAQLTLGAIGSRRTGRSGQKKTASGFDGRFLFSQLPEGEYVLMAGKTAYETRLQSRTLARVKLARNQTRKNLQIRLRPSAVVTGKLADSLGESPARTFVTAYRRSYDSAGNLSWEATQSDMTNDLGEYRIFGLAAGSYVLGASQIAEVAPRGIYYAEHLPVYYPGVSTPAEAAPLKLRWGSEQAGVDLRLPPSPRTVVRGVVLDSETGGCDTCGVTLRDRSVYSVSMVTNDEGQFTFYGVPPGPHYLLAMSGGRRRHDALMARADVLVSESDSEALVLELAPGQTVSGRLVREDPPQAENQGSTSNAGNRRWRTRVMLVGELVGWRGARTPGFFDEETGAFERPDVHADTYRIELIPPPAGGYLRAVILAGRKLEKPEITVASGAPLTGIELRVAFDGATVSGVVKPEDPDDPSAVASASIVALPDNPGGYLRRAVKRASEDGGFVFTTLVPGAYTFYALPQHSTLDPRDPDTRATLQRWAKRLRVKAKDNVTLELTLAEDPGEF